MPSPAINIVKSELAQIIKGKEEICEIVLASMLARGHVLIEDIPGVGKTTLVKSLCRLLNLKVNRVQFTQDLLPSDILGASVFNSQKQLFEFHPGPIFSEALIADELNRTSPKTQSALLQAMEERQVSIDGKEYSLPKVFLLIATQNPMDQFGTSPLPESQLDRFAIRINIGYPDRSIEKSLLTSDNPSSRIEDLNPALKEGEFSKLQQECLNIHAAEEIKEQILDLLASIRAKGIALSTRAGQSLFRVSQGYALIKGRNFITPDDIRSLAPYVIAHRIPAQDNTKDLEPIWNHV